MSATDAFQKILLINPPGKIFVRQDGGIGERKHCTPPLGLAYIAGNLIKNGYDVEIIDALAEGYSNERYIKPFLVYGLDINEIVERALDAKPDVIGFSVLFSNRIGETHEIAAAIRKVLPDVTMVFGGQHPTAMPDQVMKRPHVDFIIAGEADQSMVDLMEALNDRLEKPQVKGLFYRDGNSIINSMENVASSVDGNGWKYYERKDAPVPLELDELPYPAWEIFPMDAYWGSHVRIGGGDVMRERFLVIMSTRGCPNVCTFCTSPLLSGYKAYRRRGNKEVIAEIRHNIDTYNIQEIQFLDDNFFVSKKRVKDLCKMITKEFANDNVIFSAPAGTEANAMDEEMIDLMAAANFHKVMIAIEAGDDSVQSEHVDKKVKLDRIPALVDYIRSRGMTVHSLFMIGFPDETKAQINKTLELAMNLNVDDFFISVATPLPGTPMYDDCVERGILVGDFDPDNLRFSLANIELPDTTKEELETMRIEAWLKMKDRNNRQTGTVKKGSFKEFEKSSDFERAGITVDTKNLQ